LNTAKEIFAAIADTTLSSGEASRQRAGSKDSVSRFPQAEPAEWYPPEGSEIDNEDELMIILDTDQKQEGQGISQNIKSRSESKERPGSRGSTGFARLDEFERKLAEMTSDLEQESETAQFRETVLENTRFEDSKIEEPIYATIIPKKDREASKPMQLTDDGYYINNEHPYDTEEDVGSECSRNKKVSFAASEERYEFERQKKESGFRSFTKFLSQNLPTNVKRVPEPMEVVEPPKVESVDTPSVSITEPQRSLSVESRQSVNENTNPKAFLSAMTGGLIDNGKNEPSTVFGSLLRGRKSSRSGSRQSSRHSSGDRSSQELWSEDEGRPFSVDSQDPCDVGSDVMSDISLVNRLKKLKKRKPKHVQPADFDELFARGMAISAQKESDQIENPVARRRTKKKPSNVESHEGDESEYTPFGVYSQDDNFKASQNDAGIGYTEKVLSYLDDQAKTPHIDLTNGHEEGSHKSRGRRKHRQKSEKQLSIPQTDERSKSTEERKRSREYTKPEDIKLSPVPIRDLYTGQLLYQPPNTTQDKPEEQAKLIQKAKTPPSIAVRTEHSFVKNDTASIIRHFPHTPGLAPSPGKSFLDAVTGQEVFGASIEGENPELPAVERETMQSKATVLTTDNKDPPTVVPCSTVLAPSTIQVPTTEEPADIGIPSQLLPDKLMANEEFYEQLRSGLKSTGVSDLPFEQTQEDPESYQKYSHHLGRAEFGTLKKRASNRTSAATSRDPSGDRINAQRQQAMGLSRDPSGDRLALSSKISRQSSREVMRSDSRVSNYSGGLPDLEVDETVQLAPDEEEKAVQRTVSLLVSGVDMDRPSHLEQQKDMKAMREEVLRDIAQHKRDIREVKGWIQNGLMTVVGFGVMVYLQTLESVGQ